MAITDAQNKSVSIASIIVYLALLQPALFCFWKHGKRGFLGCYFIVAFCLIRIIGNGVTVHDLDSQTAGGVGTLVLQSVGLSPLILGALGMLHEARRARNPNIRNKLEWFLIIQYHCLVSVALALVVTGVVKMVHGDAAGKNFLKIGIVVVLVCYVLLIIWTLLSLRVSCTENAVAYAEGTTLLYGVIAALPFIGLRQIYAVGSDFATSSDFTTSFAIKVALSVVPEIIVVALFVNVGLNTRNITQVLRNGGKTSYLQDSLQRPMAQSQPNGGY